MIRITIEIPYVSNQLSIDNQKIIKNKNGKNTIGYTTGMKAMCAGIATRITGASNKINAEWNPHKPLHIRIVGWKPQSNCDLHNCLKLIVDSVVVGLQKWGIKNDSNFVVDGIQPYYNPDSPMHKQIYIFVSQLEEEPPEPDTPLR